MDKKILDVTCGGRSIWFDKRHPAAIYCDKRRESFQLEGRECIIDPDVLCDFTDLPFADNSFSLVIFDPPLPTIQEMAEDGYDIGDTCRECIKTYGSPCCTDLNPHLEYDETTGEDTEGGSECGMLDENRQGYEKYKRNGGGQNG